MGFIANAHVKYLLHVTKRYNLEGFVVKFIGGNKI